MTNVYAGVDIGGTNTVIGLFDDAMTLLAKRSIPTVTSLPERTDNPAPFLDSLAEAIRGLAADYGCSDRLRLAGMGVPGRIDPEGGVVLGASNLGWRNVPFAAEMSRRIGAPVRIDNDVRMFAYGEAGYGAGRGMDNLICLTLGTGIAAGVIAGGRLVRGSSWYAGEIGHDPVPGADARCNCGKTGCLETIASASGIARLARETAASGAETALGRLSAVTAYDVFRAAEAGDRTAADIFRYVGETLAHKLLTVIYLLNPQAVIIGGGAAAAGEWLLGPVRETIDRHYPYEWKPQVTRGLLGDAAGLYGAVRLARERPAHR